MSVLASPEYVNAGSRVTWTGQLHTTLLYATIASTIQSVSSTLLNNNSLVVEKVDNNIGLSGSGSVTLYLRTDSDRGDGENDDGLTDILNNVNDAFRANGVTVEASALNNYQPANADGTGSSGPVNTGTAQTTVAQQNAAAAANAGPTSGVFGGISDWWNKTVTQVEAGSIGFVIGGVAVVGFIIYLSVRKAAPV
jgi:phage shock protein PspC (stress-responsive transcriptional regulator)